MIGPRRLYLVAPGRLVAGDLADLVPELADAGVDLVQLREKDKEAREVVRIGERVATACRAAGVPLIVNDRPDVALAMGADGVHLGQDDLDSGTARRILGDALVGRSTHAEGEILAAGADPARLDYIAVGPVWTTPTKPGRPAVGLELVRYAADRAVLPWFAIGGVDRATLPAVIDAGARRVVVVRALTQARRPPEAASELRALLDAVPL